MVLEGGENQPIGKEYSRLKTWYDENWETGGTFTLQEDLILTGYLSLSSLSEGTITIDTGDYSIIVEDEQILRINNIIIRGSGREKPVIIVNQGHFEFCAGQVLAEKGIGVEVGSLGKITMPNNNWEKKIIAYGDYGLGLFIKKQGAEFSLFDLQLEALEENAIGIKTQSSLNLYRSEITAGGASVITENEVPIYVYDTILIPEIEDFVSNQQGRIQSVLDSPFIYANKSLKDFEFPKALRVEVCHPNGSSEITSLQVNWEMESFWDELAIGKDFKITGNYMNSDYMIMPEGLPICRVIIRENTPLTIEGSVSKRPFLMAFIEFDNPIDAKSYIIESSFDQIDWSIEEEVEKKDFDGLRRLVTPLIFDDGLSRYFRIRVDGGVCDGISNILYLGIDVPEEEKNNYGDDREGTRGSGGLINIPRENSSLEEVGPETNIPEEYKDGENNPSIRMEDPVKNNPETGSNKETENESSDLMTVLENNASVLSVQEIPENEKTRWLFFLVLGGLFILILLLFNRKSLLKMLKGKKREH